MPQNRTHFCLILHARKHLFTHMHTHANTDADKYTLAQSNWLIQYVKKLNAEKRNLFDSLSLAPLSSSEKHGWNMCSLDYMFELNRSCDLNWSAFPPHHFASSKQELGCCVCFAASNCVMFHILCHVFGLDAWFLKGQFIQTTSKW